MQAAFFHHPTDIDAIVLEVRAATHTIRHTIRDAAAQRALVASGRIRAADIDMLRQPRILRRRPPGRP